MSTDAGIYFQGWIHKKNDKNFVGDRWNKRWFVLYEDSILAYYADQVLRDKKNSVSLKGSKLKVLPKETVKKRPYCFELVTKDRTFLLSCGDEQGYRQWMYWLSKGHPNAPERPGAFFTSVIEEVLQEVEKQRRRMSLTSRVTAAAQSNFSRRERVASGQNERKEEQPVIQVLDRKRSGDEVILKPTSADSLPRCESVRVSRPWIHLDSNFESKENDKVSLPPPESEFAHKLQDFVKQNERTMEEVIDKLVRTIDEKQSKESELTI